MAPGIEDDSRRPRRGCRASARPGAGLVTRAARAQPHALAVGHHMHAPGRASVAATHHRGSGRRARPAGERGQLGRVVSCHCRPRSGCRARPPDRAGAAWRAGAGHERSRGPAGPPDSRPTERGARRPGMRWVPSSHAPRSQLPRGPGTSAPRIRCSRACSPSCLAPRLTAHDLTACHVARRSLPRPGIARPAPWSPAPRPAA